MKTALEDILVSAYKEGMIAYMHAHPEDFEEAVKLAVSDKQPYAWRAAWLLWSCMEENDARVRLYLKEIMSAIKAKTDNHQRELLKILLLMELDEEYEGDLFNHCVSLWEKTGKKPSVRFAAFKFIVKIAEKHTDLRQEIIFFAQERYLESLSPGIKRGISKMIKKLAEEDSKGLVEIKK